MADSQEILQKAMTLRFQSEEVEKQLQFVQEQIVEMNEFTKTLDSFNESEESEILAPLGKGVYMKAKKEKGEKLFVQTGAGVVVRKTPEEAKRVITGQIKKFTEVKIHLTAQLETFRHEFGLMLEEVEKLKEETKKKKQ